MHAQHTLVPFLACLCLFAGGCIFRDIRDEVRVSNARIEQVEDGLTSTKAAIDQTNDKLKDVEEGLARLDTTNSSLRQVDERLAILQSISTSLTRLDNHLASLRKTIGRIDNMIPFLDLGGEDASIAAAPANPAQPAADEVAPAEGGSAAKETAASRRDPVLGSWISQYPDRSAALVLLDGGKYLWQKVGAQGDTQRESGTWAKDGKNLRLTHEEPAPIPKPNEPAPAQPPAPKTVERTYEIVANTARSMTLQESNGRLLILNRP